MRSLLFVSSMIWSLGWASQGWAQPRTNDLSIDDTIKKETPAVRDLPAEKPAGKSSLFDVPEVPKPKEKTPLLKPGEKILDPGTTRTTTVYPSQDNQLMKAVNDTNAQTAAILGDNPENSRGMNIPGFGGGGGFGTTPPGYTLTWYPSSIVNSQGASVQMVRQNLSVGAPVYRDNSNFVIATGRVQNTLINSNIFLPDTGRQLPNNLWNISLGLGYFHQFEDNGTLGAIVSVGSASDRPFGSIDEIAPTVIGFWRLPVMNKRDAWMFTVIYNPNGNLRFPIPGIAYNWNPSEELQMNIGLPFSVVWKPNQEFSFNASYLPLTNINVMANWRFVPGVTLYGGYQFLNEAYFMAERNETQDRLMYFEQRLITGIQWQFYDKFILDCFGGFAFDRRFGEGRNQFSGLRDQLEISAGPFLGFNLRYKF